MTAVLPPVAAQAAPGDVPAQRSVVVLSDGASVKRYLRDHDITPVFTYNEVFTGFAAELSAEQRAALRHDAQVAGVVVARKLRQAPLTGRAAAGSLRAAGDQSAAFRSAPQHDEDGTCGQVVPNAVRRVGALESRTARINCRPDRDFSVGVAVLDSGIDARHPDLRVVGGQQCVGDASDPLTDADGHGTQVAGLIGAQDNDLGVVGVAPGVDLYAVKMFDDSGRSDLAGALCALDWVAQNADRIDVANMSWASAGTAPSELTGCTPQGVAPGELLRAAICRVHRRGVVPIASANNSAADVGLGVLPAAFPQSIAVSAIADFDGQPGGLAPPSACFSDEDDTFANFSDFGAAVDIAAPGVCNATTAPIASCGARPAVDTGCYTTTVGTSFAAPLVAGAAALIRQRDRNASPSEVRRRLLANAEPGPIAQDPDSFPEGVLSVRGS